VGFVNACHLYAETRLGGVAEVWKDNILEEINKGMSEVETMEELFEKMWKEFRESCKNVVIKT